MYWELLETWRGTALKLSRPNYNMRRKILEYNTIFQKEEKGYSVWVPSLPGCASQGETFEEALGNIKEAISLYLEDRVKDEREAADNIHNQFMVPVGINLNA